MKKVSALCELWSQRVVAPVNPKVKREGLREKVVSLCDVIEHVVSVDGRLHVSPENLEARPES